MPIAGASTDGGGITVRGNPTLPEMSLRPAKGGLLSRVLPASQPKVATSYSRPKPPRSDVLASPNMSQAKPSRGLKLRSDVFSNGGEGTVAAASRVTSRNEEPRPLTSLTSFRNSYRRPRFNVKL